MKKAIEVYPWNVLDEIKKRNTVYVCDKFKCTVNTCNNTAAEFLICKIERDNKDNRYLFYKFEDVDGE
uniref:Uncharacterized protein n=1 Tax=Siphoviridae sp. ctsxw88 TaxID=2825701 RepID=A0A8S5PGH6_9CAUD|nr:MAG TPA: hypothetical protein [Siphoviridae sp. ctsxw88]